MSTTPMNRTLVSLLIFSFVSLSAAAQQTGASSMAERARLGLFGNVALGLHMANFSSIPGTPNCCPEFSTATGMGVFLGATYLTPLDESLSLDIRLSYASYGVDFLTRQNLPIRDQNDNVVDATIRHDLSGSFSMIAIEPLLGFALSDNLRAIAGVTAGIVVSGTFSQSETLESPGNVTFSGLQSRVRNSVVDREMPGLTSFMPGLTLGMSYDLSPNSSGTIILTPEVLFTLSPLTVASDVSWRPQHIRGGFALRFIPPEVEDSLTDIELLAVARSMRPPSKSDPNTVFVSNVSATGVDDGGRTSPVTQVRVEEYASTRVRPLLPYVFFDQTSTDLPQRYRRVSESVREKFSLENFYNLDAMITYYHVLNIIGKRMQDDPSSSITLTGTIDESELSLGTGLSQARAAAVKDYLVSTWEIEPRRISIQARTMPESPSKSTDDDGRAENRRVEISSSNPTILAPVSSNDTMRVFQPAGIRFAPSIDPKVPIASWTMFVTDGERIIRSFHAGEPIPPSVDWRIDEQALLIPRSLRELKYLLVVRDSNGLVVPSATQTIPLNHVTLADKAGSTSDKSIDRYSLILFGFDRSDLTPANSVIVDNIKSRLSPSSTVSVLGYTDRSGADDYNLRLSEQRAKSVARALGLPESTAKGLGENLPLYDNSTPEGRFYSRTVEVLVETPRK
ncbi:MAG TPA: OmpA family protein [Chlorobiota bacterium]|mgnify:CR=1 FL=1|nr:OmpA family protein [Chlorobiota bacterium]